MFERPGHRLVARALAKLDRQLLEEAECYFGGGTAAALALGEYRESADIDFLCASRKGYRLLRQAIFSGGMSRLLSQHHDLEVRRDLRADQYGVRGAIAVDGFPIKFEIIREARIHLSGSYDPVLGVPVLSREDMFAEKLLANADRWADKAVLSRDIIDLTFMVYGWGEIPAESWDKARGAYGISVDEAYAKAVEQVRDPKWLRECMAKLEMDIEHYEPILAAHGGPRNGPLP